MSEGPSWAEGVVAHRGAFRDSGAGRNSMGALRAAMAAGYGAFECDLCWTADEVVIVAHGPRANSEDGDLDLDIRTTPWAELGQVALPGGERLASLAELLTALVAQTTTGAILEIKAPGDGSALELAERVVAEVEAAGAGPWVRYISFSYGVLRRILARAPGSHCAPLEPQPGSGPRDYLADGMRGVDFEHGVYAEPDGDPGGITVAAFAGAGLDVNTWTVDDPGIMRRFIGWGVDRITTDEPARLRQVWSDLRAGRRRE